MQLTGIDDTNRDFFAPILFVEDKEDYEELIEAGVIEDGMPIAAAAIAVDFNGHTARLITIYTVEAYRRRGAAGMMLQSLLKAAKACEAPRLDVYYTDAMGGVEELMLKTSFSTFAKGEEEIFALEDIKNNERIKSQLGKKPPYDIISFSGVDQRNRTEIDNQLKRYRLGSLAENPNEELSYVAFNAGKPVAVMFCDRVGETVVPTVMVELLASFGTDVKALMGIFIHSFASFEASGIKELTFFAADPRVSVFVKAITEGRKGQKLRYAVRFL